MVYPNLRHYNFYGQLSTFVPTSLVIDVWYTRIMLLSCQVRLIGTRDSRIDLDIWHWSGRANSNVDALSRNPVEATFAQVQSDSDSVAVDKDLVKQSSAPWLQTAVLTSLEKGSLPEDENLTKQLLFERSQFDGVLHYEVPVSRSLIFGCTWGNERNNFGRGTWRQI